MKGTKKFPQQVLVRLLEYIDENPGCSKDDLIPLVMPFFLAWFNADSAQRAALSRYILDALKRIGVEKNRREILSFFVEEGGKKARRHAVVATTPSREVLLAQRGAIMGLIEALYDDIKWIEKNIRFIDRYGVTLGLVLDGEVVERTGMPE